MVKTIIYKQKRIEAEKNNDKDGKALSKINEQHYMWKKRKT